MLEPQGSFVYHRRFQGPLSDIGTLKYLQFCFCLFYYPFFSPFLPHVTKYSGPIKSLLHSNMHSTKDTYSAISLMSIMISYALSSQLGYEE